jgi:hypothetical protein
MTTTYTGSAITPCTASVTGPGGLNESVTLTYSNNTDAGTATASATYAASANHLGNSDSKTFTISKADPTVAVTGGTFTYDGTVKAATGTVTGVAGANLGGAAISYSPGGASAPINAGTYTATGSFAGNGNYNSATGNGTITINKANQTITWAQPAAISYGTALSATQLNATVAGVNGGTQPGALSYDRTTGTVLNAGTHNLTATAAATDNYNSASKMVGLVVNPATTTIRLDSLVKAYKANTLQAPQVIVPTVNSTPVKYTLAFYKDAADQTPMPVTGVTEVGVYKVVATLNDPNYTASPASVEGLFVIYDASAGFVTGGGWIDSKADYCLFSTACAAATGKANFGFVSKYQKGATVPTGETEFQFQAGGFRFKSQSYEWLTVAGARAQYKGVGAVNGGGRYGFILTAVDGQINGGGNTDKFRIKIWEKNVDGSDGRIVYDNQTGATDTSDPSTFIGGGSIVIHSK